jgi:hypothetical protein
MMRIHGGMSAALLLAAACGAAEGKSVGSLEKVPVVGFDSLFHRVDSVMLITPPEEAIGRASGVVVLPTTIVLTDGTRGNIKVFSKQGRLLRTLGQPGDGPGEFRRPIGIVKDGRGQLVVLDLVRNVLSTRDTSGTLLSERVVPGPWDNMAALPGTDHILLIGGRVRKGKEEGVNGEQMALHDVDSAGAITNSYHSFKWPSDPFQATFTHFFATAVGEHLVAGAFSSNRVYFVNRRTGVETSALVGGPWYRAPAWSKLPPKSVKNGVEVWAKQQVLLIKLFAVDGGRYLAQFRSYAADGEELYRYVLADTTGASLVSTLPTRLRILLVQGETAYGIVTTPTGDAAFETFRLLAPLQH